MNQPKYSIRTALGRMTGKKYILLPADYISVSGGYGYTKCHRIKALVDIPQWGVTAGDIGGFVESYSNLDQNGDAWVGRDAFVVGMTFVTGDSLVTGNSLVYAKESLRMEIPDGPNRIRPRKRSLIIRGNSVIIDSTVKGKVSSIDQRSLVQNSKVELKFGNLKTCQILQDTVLESVTLWDKLISPNAQSSIKTDSIFGPDPWEYPDITKAGKEKLNAPGIPSVLTLEDTVPSYQGKHKYRSDAAIEQMLTRIRTKVAPAKPGIQAENFTPSTDILHKENSSEMCYLNDALSFLESEYKSYTEDVVNLIKYPLMVDLNFAPTREFVHVLRKARRLAENGTVQDFKAIVETAEKNFLIAESEARRVSVSMLDEKSRRKLESAETLMALAADTNASLNERELSLKQGFRQLEGIVNVPEVAKDVFRVKVGLREITR